MTYSSRRKEVDMKKVIMIISVAAILVGCKGKGTRVQISDSFFHISDSEGETWDNFDIVEQELK